MSIDYDKFLDDVRVPIVEYTGINQLIKRSEIPKIKEKLFEYPRIIFELLLLGDRVYMPVETRELVESENEDFEYDILRKYYLNPSCILSFSGFGLENNKVIPYMQKLSQWFDVRDLGRNYLRDHNCVVRNISEINNITTKLDNDQQELRWNLDVRLEFEDVVEVRLDTIEEVQGTINGIPYKEEL